MKMHHGMYSKGIIWYTAVWMMYLLYNHIMQMLNGTYRTTLIQIVAIIMYLIIRWQCSVAPKL